jgi:hypothetical protein
MGAGAGEVEDIVRFSWTGNMQEDDDAAGFIEGFSFKHDIKFLFKGTCFSIIARLVIIIFCFLQRRYQCLPPPLHLLPCKDEKNGNDKSTCNKNKKQRKSNSSDMIDLMKDFITQQQVDKEKQRQERQNLHNDKKAILPFFSSFSSAPVQLPSNSLRFSWTGNMQEDDDAAGFIEGFPSNMISSSFSKAHVFLSLSRYFGMMRQPNY